MKKLNYKMIVLPLILILVLVLVILGIISFFAVKKEADIRFSGYENKTQSINTKYGKISFIDEGNGVPVLSCHGICGGYDQAYDTPEEYRDKIRLVAPSRFGYPGSDLPENATVEMQVEAFIELLDFLDLKKVYLLATSAGSTVAYKFALMHPERTSGLILYCSGFPATEPSKKELKYAGPPSAFCHDFTMWLISPLFKPLMGMEKETLKSIIPMKDRKAGIIFDGKITNTVMVNNYQDYDLSKLSVPVLIIHAKDDKLANFKTVEPWLSKIKDCTFVPLEGGGHLMTGSGSIIRDAVEDFIN